MLAAIIPMLRCLTSLYNAKFSLLYLGSTKRLMAAARNNIMRSFLFILFSFGHFYKKRIQNSEAIDSRKRKYKQNTLLVG